MYDIIEALPNALIIKQKQSNSGSIYDLASDMFDRVISLNRDHKYIVIVPAYYNMSSTRHKSEYQAGQAKDRLVRQGYEAVIVLDREGNQVFFK
ncbi:MAG TPA: hypothetical protein VNU45_18060 [Rummeliibacillus sp.]|nr:hypothetical protein [Rummeliibacillus sp.]